MTLPLPSFNSNGLLPDGVHPATEFEFQPITDMRGYSRSSEEIKLQLRAFKATMPAGLNGPPKGDFAAELQWGAWQDHLKELEDELDEALAQEVAKAQSSNELSPLVPLPQGVAHNFQHALPT